MSTPASFIYSLFLFFGMFAFAGALLLFIQFRKSPQPYVTHWVISSILIGSATVLVALREILPAFISYDIGNSLNVASYIYVYASFLCLLGRDLRYGRVALWAFTSSLLFVLALMVVRDTLGIEFQPAVVALCGAVLNLCTVLPAVRFYKLHKTTVVLTLALVFGLNGLVWGIRVVTILVYGVGFAFDGGPINALTFTLLLALGIARYMCFIGVVASIEWQKNEDMITENHLIKLALANKKIEQTELQFLASLNALAKARDNETGNHILRTQQYVLALAERLHSRGHHLDSLDAKAIDSLVRAAPLHDIGKIGIPDDILLKKGVLSDEEWEIMKTHTLIGEAVLDVREIERDAESDVIAKSIKIAGGHHERWDGTGYPRGLVGEAIPLEARIMSVADMYDALVSERPYKKAWSHERAVKEIKRGTQFDPVIVDAFIDEQDTFKDIAQKYRDT